MKRQPKNIKSKVNLEQPPTPNSKKQIQSPSYTNASLLESSRPTEQYIHQQYNQTTETSSKKQRKSNAISPKTPQRTEPIAKIAEQGLPVELKQVSIPNDEAHFLQNILIGVRYTIHRPLDENIKWRLIYLGSAFSDRHDQVLLNFETPDTQRSIQSAQREFKLQCVPPKIYLIPPQQIFSISAIVLSASYKNQEFARVGFYIHYQTPSLQTNQQRLLDLYQGKTKQKPDYSPDNQNGQNNKAAKKSKKIAKQKKDKILKSEWPLAKIGQAQISSTIENIVRKTVRTILVDKPRVTKFQIQWQKKVQETMMVQQHQFSDKYMEIQNEFDSILQDQHQITQYYQPIGKSRLFQQTIASQKQRQMVQSDKKVTRIVNTWTLTAQGEVICQNVQRFYE